MLTSFSFCESKTGCKPGRWQ